METMTMVSRRDFLRTGGAVVVGFAIGVALPRFVLGDGPPGSTDLGKPVDPNEVDSFLAVHADGSVTLYTSKVDVGTGLRTAMSQMAAEELGVSVERVSVVEGDTAVTPDQGGTGGSTGIPQGAVRVRQAAATARQAFLKLGAAQLHVPAEQLTIVDGMVRPVSGGAGIALGTLAAGKRIEMKVDAKAPLKSPANYTIVGQPLKRPEVAGRCTGANVFVQDVTLPGMLHGRVVRPPTIGATIVSVDEGSIAAIPNARVVRIENFLGVVASDEWAAVRAARELKVNWSTWEGLPGSEGLDKYVRAGEVEKDQVVLNRGDSAKALEGATNKVSGTFWWPCQSHASLGPSCAVADVRGDGATVWSSSQGIHGLRKNLAKVFGIPEEKLRVIFVDGSGSYGGNGNDDVAADALLLSKQLGKPVRVQWMRQDEHGWDPKGPAQLLEVRGGIDAQGRIAAWETEMWVPTTVPGNRPLLAADAARIPQDHGLGSGAMTFNADPPYETANIKVVAHLLKETPLRPSNLRAPGKIANVFAVECMTDELAAAAGVDPLEFRLRGLSDPRAIEALKRAAEMIGWEKRPAASGKRATGNLAVGRGLAYARYKQMENYVALAMEVEVNLASGKVRVRRVACAHDCGLIVNPDGLRNQVEGSIVQTIGRSLFEEVKFDRSRVTSVDWASYPILRFPDAPEVQVALIDRPNEPPVGAGEAAGAPVTAAIANAVFDATGVRLRSVPFTPERVKAALAAGAGG